MFRRQARTALAPAAAGKPLASAPGTLVLETNIGWKRDATARPLVTGGTRGLT